MHVHRHARAARLAVALTAPFALLLALPTTAHAAEPVSPPAPGTTAPAAVLASIAPGGDAFEEAVQLNASDYDGSVDSSKLAPDTTRFGRMHLELRFDPTSRATGGEPTGDDFSETSWVAIEYLDGEAAGSVALESDGSLACLGDGCGVSTEDAGRIEPLAVDVAVLNAGIPTVTAEVFALSADRHTVTPLNHDARALVGHDPVSFATFRAAAVHELTTWLAKQPTDLPSDALGAAGGPADASEDTVPATHLSFGTFVGRLSLFLVPVAALAFVLGERRRARREPAS